MSRRLEGKIALISGTGGGQGRAAALEFAAEGAVIVGCDVKEDGHRETVELVEAAGGRMTGSAPVDLGDPDQARHWVDDAAAANGRIDIVYNNASAARFVPFGEMSVEDWRFTMRNELDIVFHVTRAAWPHLVSGGGGVVLNTASVTGWIGLGQGGVAHCATKGGVLAMTRALAVEGKAHGIRVVSISPGPIETPGTAELFADPQARAGMQAGLLVDRLGQPGDVAGLAAFLASDQAGFITGSDVIVDGGMCAI